MQKILTKSSFKNGDLEPEMQEQNQIGQNF